jgi:hypothetical protein
VYHWDVMESKTAAPRKIFDRQEQLEVGYLGRLQRSDLIRDAEQSDHQLRDERR